MEAIILAGGLGTRLRSRLTNLPKSMAPIGGIPFLEILLDRLIGSGCSRVVLSVGHLRQVIFHHFGSAYRGVPVHYVIEEAPLGTGGAIRLGLQHVQEPAVLVLNGDTYLDVDHSALLAQHLFNGCSITMAVIHVEEMSRYGGVVVDDGNVVGFIEKGRIGPGWINAGTYVLNRNFPWPERLPAQFSFETDVLVPFLDCLRPAAFRCEGHFLDIGVPDDLDRAQVELVARKFNRTF